MLSLTSEYALRALIYLTQHESDWPIPGHRIAEHAKIPPKYLSKILCDLVRIGILMSSPGKSGGFWLGRSARRTRLYEVLVPFESFERKRCPFGNEQCSDKRPCAAHKKWKSVVEAEQRFLQKTTLFDISGEAAPPRLRRKVKTTPKKRKKPSSSKLTR